MRTRMWGIVVAVGVAMGGQPQGCEQTGKGRMIEPFEYLTREEGYQPPVPGEVTLYQTNGPVTAGAVQALAEGADGTVYAGTFGDGIYTKAVGADVWVPATEGPGDRFLLSLMAMPSGEVFAGTIQGGVFRSDDGGRHWVATGEGIGAEQVAAILHDPRSGLVYAGTGSGVFKSADNGRRWTAANRGLEVALARSLALGKDGTLYTGTGGNGLFASQDQGVRWRSINEGLSDERGLRENFIRVLTIDRAGAVYAGSFGGGVFRSTNQGRVWTPVNEGLTNLSIRGLVVGPDAIYVGTGDGVFRSDSAGLRWDSISEGMPNKNVQSLLLTRDGLLYAGTSGGIVVRGADGAWRGIDRGLLFPTVQSLLVDARRGMFAGTQSNGLYRSKDGGQSWGPFNDGIESRTIAALAADATGTLYAATPETVYRADWTLSRWVPEGDGLSGTVAALGASPKRLYAGTSSGLFARHPSDPVWTPVGLDGSAAPVRALALDSDRRPVVLSGRDLFRGEDGAGAWEALGTPPGSEALLGVAAGGGVYAWTDRAVFMHRGDQSWQAVKPELPRGVSIRALAVDVNGRDDVLLAATSGGTWWTDGRREWRPVHGTFPVVPYETVLVAGTGLIVAGTREHGVFVGVDLVPKRSWFDFR